EVPFAVLADGHLVSQRALRAVFTDLYEVVAESRRYENLLRPAIQLRFDHQPAGRGAADPGCPALDGLRVLGPALGGGSEQHPLEECQQCGLAGLVLRDPEIEPFLEN